MHSNEETYDREKRATDSPENLVVGILRVEYDPGGREDGSGDNLVGR